MDSLVVPGLDTLRRWLDEIGISFFECDSCQALHLPHMQNFDGIFDAKIDLVDNVVLFSALAEVKPSALLALSADLSAINASSLTVKAFIDIQDDNLPKLVVCQSLSIGPGVTMEQFRLVLPPKRRADLNGDPRSRRQPAAVQRRRRRARGGKRAIPFSSLNLPKISAATTAAAAYYPLLFCVYPSLKALFTAIQAVLAYHVDRYCIKI